MRQDRTHAVFARMDVEGTRERWLEAEKLLLQGKTVHEINDNLRNKFGMSTGPAVLSRLRAKLQNEGKLQPLSIEVPVRAPMPTLPDPQDPPTEAVLEEVRAALAEGAACTVKMYGGVVVITKTYRGK